MSSVLLECFASSENDGRDLVDDDPESLRRRLDNVVKNSDEAEPVFTCEFPVGVAGGVRAPLWWILPRSFAPKVEDRSRVGDSGGVDAILTGCGLESRPPGTASL